MQVIFKLCNNWSFGKRILGFNHWWRLSSHHLSLWKVTILTWCNYVRVSFIEYWICIICWWKFLNFLRISLTKLLLIWGIWLISLSLTSLITSAPWSIFMSSNIIMWLWCLSPRINYSILVSSSCRHLLGFIKPEWLNVIVIVHIFLP